MNSKSARENKQEMADRTAPLIGRRRKVQLDLDLAGIDSARDWEQFGRTI